MIRDSRPRSKSIRQEVLDAIVPLLKGDEALQKGLSLSG